MNKLIASTPEAGAESGLERLHDWREKITPIWADGGYAGKLAAWARQKLQLTLGIVKHRDDTTGFVVLRVLSVEVRLRGPALL
ncbi:hypothetical protein ABT294_50115 [Nonomuraea sp. NPDC000554]|uniref:hypothetical protein n=1 Tax=Nonomuraea sp. NPDC000554 TaxID=3154259 RepID=UPI00331E8795